MRHGPAKLQQVAQELDGAITRCGLGVVRRIGQQLPRFPDLGVNHPHWAVTPMSAFGQRCPSSY